MAGEPTDVILLLHSEWKVMRKQRHGKKIDEASWVWV
jgi:hypothetical protein